MNQIKKIFSLCTLVLVLALAGCKSAEKSEETSDTPNTEVTETTQPSPETTMPADPNSGDANVMGDSDSGKAMGLQTVYFPYDSFSMDAEAKSTLKANAEILTQNPSVKVQIEGHCDQRGGIQYNIALGEKRASAVKNQLKAMGIGSDRMTTISYGKERPLDASSAEEAYAKNRRGNFVITSK